MNCHSFINVLDLHQEGRLTPRLARRVEEHLKDCASCRALTAPARAAEPAGRAPKSLKAKLLAAAESASPAAPRPSPDLKLWPREARGIALAAALLLAVGLLVSAVGAQSQWSGGLAAVEEP